MITKGIYIAFCVSFDAKLELVAVCDNEEDAYKALASRQYLTGDDKDALYVIPLKAELLNEELFFMDVLSADFHVPHDKLKTKAD